MITRNTKSEPTNRQRQEAAAEYTPEMLKGAKYEHFKFSIEWLAECERQSTTEQNTALYYAIVFYGLGEKEPQGLSPEAMEYFNREIRPELDRQHKRLNEGKQL